MISQKITPNIPPQSTPVMDDLSPALMSKPWWIGLKKAFDAIVYLLGLDFVYGGSALTTVGAIPKVTAAATVGQSSLTDNGTRVTGTEQISIDQGATPASSQFQGKANALGCIELLSYSADNSKVLFDGEWVNPNIIARDTSVGVLVKNGAKLNIYGQTGAVVGSAATLVKLATIDLATGDVDAVTGVYKVAGTQVVGAQLAAVSAPTIATSGVAQTSGATYTSNEQNMLASLKAAVLNLNTDVTNLQTAANDIRSRLSTHGLTL
jgi:hypothetical protein